MTLLFLLLNETFEEFGQSGAFYLFATGGEFLCLIHMTIDDLLGKLPKLVFFLLTCRTLRWASLVLFWKLPILADQVHIQGHWRSNA